MRLWLNHSGEVSLLQQLSIQIVLAILSGELAPGERLPSIRELARRFRIHANTASAAYRELASQGWLEFRHGSGVFVRGTKPLLPISPSDGSAHAVGQMNQVDQIIGEMVARARELGASPALVRERLQLWMAMEPPSRWLMIEPDPELRAIILFELESALRLPISGCSPDALKSPEAVCGTMPLCLPNRTEMVRALLPTESALTTLHLQAIAPSLASYLPAPPGALIGIASRWSGFQRIAQTFLIATGIPPESLLIRDATEPDWKRGLEQARAVLCDAATEPTLPKTRRPIVFRFIAASSIVELKNTEASLVQRS
jgi:DNA-binding transcriptional regulator YhcF (GntR family)